jgi:hypothetical protein
MTFYQFSRSCGGGFCENCSAKSRPVPERGWGDQPVRVCDRCFEKGLFRLLFSNLIVFNLM